MENPLYISYKTTLFLGDANDTVSRLVGLVRENS